MKNVTKQKKDRSVSAPTGNLIPPSQLQQTISLGRQFFQSLLRQGSALIGLVLLVIIAAILSKPFLSPNNIMNVLQQISMYAMVAMGMTFVIISGGIDLSVGATVGLTAEIMGLMVLAGVPYTIAIPTVLVMGFAMGALNGFIIHTTKITPFIVTLATLQVFRGLVLIVTGGNYQYNLPKVSWFEFLGQGHILAFGSFNGIPVPPLIVFGLAIIGWFVLSRTKLGRNTYAIGGNEEAARLAGINIGVSKVLIYGICGLFCGIAGVVQTSRLMSTYTGLGSGWELEAIAATVMGGTAFSGGIGGVAGTIIGSLILGVIKNILVLVKAEATIQMIVIGLVVLLAVVVDKLRTRLSNKA
jgi:ribose transport system permease protein